MKKMVEWSVAANRAETGWLAAKLDTTEDRLSIRIQMVQDALATSNTAALQEAKEAGTSKTQQIPAYCSMFSTHVPLRGEWIHVGGVGRRRCWGCRLFSLLTAGLLWKPNACHRSISPIRELRARIGHMCQISFR